MDKKTKKILKDNGEDYCKNTSLHGFSYWVLDGTYGISNYSLVLRLFLSIDASIFDKIFWVVMVLAGITCGLHMVTGAFIDWANYPTRMYDLPKKIYLPT